MNKQEKEILFYKLLCLATLLLAFTYKTIKNRQFEDMHKQYQEAYEELKEINNKNIDKFEEVIGMLDNLSIEYKDNGEIEFVIEVE